MHSDVAKTETMMSDLIKYLIPTLEDGDSADSTETDAFEVKSNESSQTNDNGDSSTDS